MAQVNVELSETPLAYDLREARKNLGVVALATDQTCERDFARIFPMEQVGIFVNRVAFSNPTTPENLRKMGPLISDAAALILPSEPLEVICYSCTSASVVMGDSEIEDFIHQARPDVPVVTPSGSARQAFAALNVTKISVLTPYLVETSQPMARYFERHRLEIMRFDCLGLEDDSDMARVDHNSIIEATLATDTPETQAFFLSCTALQAVDVIAQIEKLTGKPVVTSNQASAWAMANYAGIKISGEKWGQLFNRSMPNLDIIPIPRNSDSAGIPKSVIL
jgi:maleate isomerase